MVLKEEHTVATVAARSGKSPSTVRRIIRALERDFGEEILLVRPGLTRYLEVDMEALERSLTKARTRKRKSGAN
jgi:DNA-binding transcriptional LysR family regulator